MIETYNDPATIYDDGPAGILLCDHYTESFGYKAYRPKGGQDWLITFTLGGRGEYTTNQAHFYCHPGDVVILRPGVTHRYETPEDDVWDFQWVEFLPRPHWIELLQLPEAAPGVHFIRIGEPDHYQRLQASFQRLIHESHGYGKLREALMLHALEEVLLILAQTCQTDGKLDKRVEETLRLLSEHLEVEHSINDLANNLFISPSRLAHLFKLQVGDSILSTLIKMRLRKAERLLLFSDKPIYQIAEEVGFKTPYYFTKQFTLFYGMNPSEYRERMH